MATITKTNARKPGVVTSSPPKKTTNPAAATTTPTGSLASTPVPIKAVQPSPSGPQTSTYGTVNPYVAPVPSMAASPSGFMTGNNQTITQPNNTSLTSIASNVANASGVGSGNSGYNPSNTDPLTGAVAGYGWDPKGLQNVYNSPTTLTDQILASLGVTNNGLSNSLAQDFDPALTAQFLLNNGQNSSDNDTLNWINEALKQMVTPGGRTPELDALVNHLLGAGSGSPDNLLSTFFGSAPGSQMSNEQQVSTANNAFNQLLGGQNPYAQSAYGKYAKDAGQGYLNNFAGSTNPNAPASYIDYLNQGPLKQWVAGS